MLTIAIEEPTPRKSRRMKDQLERKKAPKPKRGKGRPKGSWTKKRRKKPIESIHFDDTPLGYFLKHECPEEWEIVKELCNTRSGVNPYLIDTIMRTSGNEIFKTPRFRRAIADYKKHGLKTTPVEQNLEYEIELIRKRLRVV